MKLSGILLIIAGLAAVLCTGPSYASHDDVPNMGLIQADDAENLPVRIPPVLGFAGIAAGGGLVYFGKRRK
jgi:hypothetical protein